MLKKVFKITFILMVVLAMAFKAVAQDTISMNTFHAFDVSWSAGYTYRWWYENAAGEKVPFASESNTTEDVFWDTEGRFNLFVQATDANGCLSEIVSKPFVVMPVEGFIPSLVALPDINVGYENTTLYGDVSINDFDFRNQGLELVYSPEGEAPEGFVLFSDGTYEYTPPAGFTGKVNFSYRVCYVEFPGECAGANVEIRILPLETTANIAPVAVTDVALTLPNQTVFSNLLVNDIDPDGFGVPLVVNTTPLTGPQNGTAVINSDGSFAYTPYPGYTGIDRFMYRVCDSGSPVMCDSAWVYIIVSEFGGDGQKPISASDDMFLHTDGGVYTLRGNDHGQLGESLVYNTQPVIPASHGTLQIYPDGTFTYVPEPDYVGVDWFVYQVCNTDNPPDCVQGTGFILITPGNQWVELAGRDTTIGSCEPYSLSALDVGEGFSYSWEPAHLLDDAQSLSLIHI